MAREAADTEGEFQGMTARLLDICDNCDDTRLVCRRCGRNGKEVGKVTFCNGGLTHELGACPECR